ncbi:MAG: respiratory nitrate reductase subunit gamma, partial [Chloroflexota bacterium]|jgi:nitrate reductase gamma subunit
MATFGAVFLLWRRLTNPDLSRMSTLSDYLNLIVILAAFLGGVYAWLTADNSFALLRDFFRSALTFSAPASVHPAVATELILASVFMIYLPFTHMTHFVAKYFTYHTVRWDDAPNMNDPKTLEQIQSCLNRPVGWSAPHIHGEKTWAETATEVKQ